MRRWPVVLTQSHLVKQLPQSESRVVCLDTEWDAIGKASRENLGRTITERNLAYMIYTSGSTGKPKGAQNEHRGIVNRLLWMQEQYGLSAKDRVLQKTPFSFDVSVWEFFWPLQVGARLVVARPGGHRDAAYLAEADHRSSRSRRCTLCRRCCGCFWRTGEAERCVTLRQVICSGEALPYELQEKFFERVAGAELHNLYGPTEAAVDVTHWTCERNSARKVVPIGRPVANTQIYILDRNLQPVPVGVTGRVVYRWSAGGARVSQPSGADGGEVHRRIRLERTGKGGCTGRETYADGWRMERSSIWGERIIR